MVYEVISLQESKIQVFFSKSQTIKSCDTKTLKSQVENAQFFAHVFQYRTSCRFADRLYTCLRDYVVFNSEKENAREKLWLWKPFNAKFWLAFTIFLLVILRICTAKLK